MRSLAVLATYILSLLSAPPCYATYAMECSGQRDTPELTLKMNGDLQIYNLTLKGKGMNVNANSTTGSVLGNSFGTSAYIIGQSIAKNDRLELKITRLRKVIATISLKGVGESGSFVGTMILDKRKYWLSCEGIG